MMSSWGEVAGKPCQICGDPATHYYGDMLICCGCHVGEKDGGIYTRDQAQGEHDRIIARTNTVINARAEASRKPADWCKEKE